MKRKIVINLFGGPGSGKSTTAAGVFRALKLMGKKVELVTEYAKDVVWEQNYTQFHDQIYIFAQQQRRISRVFDHDIDIVVTDSPILMSGTYIPDNYFNNLLPLIIEVWNHYENINFFVERPPVYVTAGRNQTHEEAIQKDNEILDSLHRNNSPYSRVNRDSEDICDIIVQQVLAQIKLPE